MNVAKGAPDATIICDALLPHVTNFVDVNEIVELTGVLINELLPLVTQLLNSQTAPSTTPNIKVPTFADIAEHPRLLKVVPETVILYLFDPPNITAPLLAHETVSNLHLVMVTLASPLQNEARLIAPAE